MIIGNIPPRTMREVWREQNGSGTRTGSDLNLSLGNLGGLVNKIKELDSRINISSGRGFTYGSMATINRGRTNRERTIYGFDVSQHVKKPRQKLRIATVQYEPQIECRQDIIENYNGNGDLGVILEFTNLDFLERVFTKNRNDHGQNTCGYHIRVTHRSKEACLRLSTTGDIFEYEVMLQKNGSDRLFNNEVFLPDHIPDFLKVYDPLSMGAVQKNGLVLVNYKKQKEN